MCISVRNSGLSGEINTGCAAETSCQQVGADWWNGVHRPRNEALTAQNRIVEAASNHRAITSHQPRNLTRRPAVMVTDASRPPPQHHPPQTSFFFPFSFSSMRMCICTYTLPHTHALDQTKLYISLTRVCFASCLCESYNTVHVNILLFY